MRPVTKPTTEPQIPIGSVHRALLVVDIENSTGRRDPVKARLRHELYHLLEEALRTSGILPRHRDALIDRGDGVLVLIHPADHLPKALLLTTLVPTLDRLLAEHNAAFPQLAFRLRVVVHAGEVHYDLRGAFGEAIDLICRLLNAPELKATLRQGEAPTALAVSHHVYDTVVRHDHAGIADQAFQPLIRVDVGGTVRHGWVLLTRSGRHGLHVVRERRSITRA
jgi:hypothetical protein